MKTHTVIRCYPFKRIEDNSNGIQKTTFQTEFTISQKR
jgi:hypothetical protein